MLKIATLAGALALATTTTGFAQTTGPSGQQDTNKPGPANPQSGSGMSSGAMTKSNSTGMTGASSGAQTTPGSTTGPSGGTQKTDKK